MKTSLQKLFILLATTSFGVCVAQPTLTDANCNPLAGETFTIIVTPTVSAGSAGANQNWNLSAMSFSATANVSIALASSTPSSGLYPGAGINYYDGKLSQFFKTSTSSLQYYGGFYYGGSATGTNVVKYSNPIDYLHLPCNFNDTYTDAFEGSRYPTSGIAPTFVRLGSATVTADGYGTLTVPNGTFTNVMRVRMQSTFRDSIQNNTFVLTGAQEEYLWYKPGKNYPVAGIINYDGDMRGFYISNYTTGLNERNNEAISFDLFPNPASDLLNIHFPVSATKEMQIAVYNSIGQELKTINMQNALTDDLKIEISDLPNGIYILQVNNNGTLLNTKRFIINR